MKISLSHIAIAVPQMEVILKKLKALALELESTHDVPTEKVKVAMIPVEVSDHFRIEILEATSPDSPLTKFLEKNSKGGMHHLSFEVDGIENWKALLEKKGLSVLPPGIRKAARGRALFLHPKDMGGVLIELEEIE